MVSWDSDNFFETATGNADLESADDGIVQLSACIAYRQENENTDGYDVDPPGYEEAAKYPSISTWQDSQTAQSSHLIRQNEKE